jgi:hypothetical protein
LRVLKLDAVPLGPRVVVWFFFEGNDLYNDQEFENTMRAPRDVRATTWTERHGLWCRSLIRNVYGDIRLRLYPIVPSYCPYFGTMRAGPYRGQRVLFAGGGLSVDGVQAGAVGTGQGDPQGGR